MKSVKELIVKSALFGLLGLLVPAAPRAQDAPLVPPRATGLIPLDARQLDEIVATWPRITRVGLNALGFERVNAVRAAKGKPALDPALVLPVGGETQAARAAELASVQAVSANETVAGDLPVLVDNSQLRFFPPIRSQGSLGSCASFASTYVQLSYMTALQRNLDIRDPADNTNKYSPKWSYNMVNGGSDDGSSLFQNYALLYRHGAATWAEFPYDMNAKAWCLNAAAWRNALGVRTKAPQYVREASTDVGIELTKELLADGYILVFGTYINSWVFQNAKDDPSTTDDDAAVNRSVAYYQGGSDGSHAMTIVGYNDAVWTDVNGNDVIDAGEKGAYRIANTWGTGWYESGFTWLAYDALRSVSRVIGGPTGGRIPVFQGDLLYVLTARAGYSPLMIGEFTASHLKRSQLKITLGRSNTSATLPSTTWTPAALQNQGGAFAFDGTTTEVGGTFALDLTDILVPGAGAQRYYLGVNDNATGDPAALTAFKIVDLTTDPDTDSASSLVPQTIDAQQGYAYVDYVYAGPAYNNPPQLTSPQVSPVTGNAGATYTFNVRYSDPDGDVPTVKNLVLDGVAQPLGLIGGQPPADGWYTLPLILAAGAHSYAFYFEDGRGESARAPIAGTINGPAVYGHILTSLSPSTAGTGSPGFTLAVNGADFLSGAVVTWDGADRPTSFVSGSRVEAAIPAGDLNVGKAVPVVVRNPGGVLSNTLTFTVTNPSPSLSSVSPAELTGGGSGAVLTLTGSQFVSNASVRWNHEFRETTYIGPTEVRASLTAADLAAAGEFEVMVVNPVPGGGASQGLSCAVSDFTVAASPAEASVAAGKSATFQVTLTPQYGSFDSPIALSCTGLPQSATASFAPPTVTPGAAAATVTLTLTTKSRSGSLAALAGPAGGLVPPLLAYLLAAAGAAWLVLGLRRGPSAPVRRRAAAAALILLVIVLAGCSAGGSSDPKDPGTPAGTYAVGVKATSGGLSSWATISFTVQ